MRKALLVAAGLAGALLIPVAPAHAALTCNGLTVTRSGDDNNNSIIGTEGNDVIFAGGGNDTVLGLGGNDTVCLGAGNDRFEGGAGNDTMVSDVAADGADTFIGSPNNPFNGVDTALYSGRTTPVTVTLDGNANDGAANERDNIASDVTRVVGGSGNDVIDLSAGLGQTTVDGGPGNDTLAANTNLAGGAGDDTLRLVVGGSGSLFGGDGNDRVFGGPFSDNISGGNGNDRLSGGDGNDALFGGEGDDLITGEAGPDFLFGEAGNDELIGGLGNDGAIGGDGNDSSGALVSLDGADTFDGGAGIDTANYSARQFGAGRTMTVSLDSVANDGEPGEGDNNRTDVENVNGAIGPNVITGNSSANVLRGGQSADVIRAVDGISGNDTVIGGFGGDVCFVDLADIEDCEF
ncbi:calcium-binding protein [Lentzea sp. BCCO 10_0856]|uniref:Calcium-binding protein n=1 Tax=Lentzea miocenica TaxID=3095431 RepID=A0ABU4TBH3_9PSEU|nr:calcium-binding protein [Lentzea sp. BCCO 10_0856]MDX8035525.1 calcium-binding protein [Lentzea sp. BCCO 10_0856]